MNTKNKTVIIGKGPSARNIKSSKDYSISCLNNSIVLCEEVDYLFINDFEVLELIEEKDWTKVKKLILPTYPHKNKKPNKNLPYTSFLKKIPNQNIDYHVYRMHTCLKNNPKFPYFGIIHSVAITAAYWLGHRGYKNIDYCGIDPTGGYNKIFLDKNKNNHACHPQSVASYVENYNYFINVSKKFNIKLNKI